MSDADPAKVLSNIGAAIESRDAEIRKLRADLAQRDAELAALRSEMANMQALLTQSDVYVFNAIDGEAHPALRLHREIISAAIPERRNARSAAAIARVVEAAKLWCALAARAGNLNEFDRVTDELCASVSALLALDAAPPASGPANSSGAGARDGEEG